MPDIFTHTFSNGLTLLGEPVAGAQSLAMTLQTPAGVASEPQGQLGVGALLAEMICRGAGSLDARAHSDALDQLGVQRGSNVETYHLRLGARMISDKLPDALPLLLDMIRKPLLEEKSLEPSRDLALQTIESLEDEPQQKVLLALRDRHYPAPFGRSPYGQADDLEKITHEQVRAFWQNRCVPAGSVIAFAGRFDWTKLIELVERQLGDWRGGIHEPKELAPSQRGYQHLDAQSAQVYIGVGYDAIPEPHPSSWLAKTAAAVLSGGMSGRLFTEVREKRGLCYAVFAAYAGQRDRGAMLSYAGTTTPRAQETLDVLRQELVRLSQGVTQDEFDRAIVGMKSRLVMQGESTAARARAIAADQFILGEPQTLEQLAAKVDAVNIDALRDYLKANPPAPGAMTIVTIGPNALSV